MQEIWKSVNGYEGIYEVSNLGNIRSLKFNKIKNIRPGLNTSRYFVVVLCKNNTQITKKLHRLIAKSFIDNPENKPCINHKDGNKVNNIVSNLVICNNYMMGIAIGAGRSSSALFNTIEKCEIFNNGINGVYAYSYPSSPVSDNQIKYCRIYNNSRYGIEFSYFGNEISNNIISDCDIFKNEYGIFLNHSNNNLFCSYKKKKEIMKFI